MPHSSTTWRLWADRRHHGPQLTTLGDELLSLEATVVDLQVHLLDTSTFLDHPTRPGFRNFGPFADLHHPSPEALQLIGADLLHTYGWLIDLQTNPDLSSS